MQFLCQKVLGWGQWKTNKGGDIRGDSCYTNQTRALKALGPDGMHAIFYKKYGTL